MNRVNCEGAGNFTGIVAAHAVTDNIESKLWVGHKPVLVVSSFETSIGFGAM